ncbi:putative histone-lysine N-methyltransferase PRDM6 [Amphibalanus amphitrite]|uniref:putative histone-lysine N-methyltransferase PRDM6 n=1 Tax=Amphibalanus amphitrite TaxID=1232801 RepID=UPI001C92A973|nr:putative histone-lysine N-methyltransferase PRDM6 [Amphibalanus amphitrite]XP_043203599.1 putative histone-lysine N-methyltransferase PRDM6 [Amphibalanus amphitrite]
MDNGEDNQDGQNEEPSPFVPDLGLPSDESVNHGQGNGGGAVGGAVGGGGEAPLSFRRFLEPPGGGAARPYVAAGLPELVQALPDHLAPSAEAGAAREPRDWQSPAAAATGTRRKVPSSSAAAAAGGAAAVPPGQPLGLPDFLSDGPMGTLHAAGAAEGPHRDVVGAGAGGARLRPAVGHAEGSQQRIQRLELENAGLRRDVERLQQQLQHERTRTSVLQAQLDSTAAAAAVPPPASPEGEGRLQEEVRSLRAQNAELRRRAGAVPSAQQAAAQMEQAAASAEQLISQLTSGVRSLRSLSASLGGAAAAEEVRPDPLPDLGRPPSGEPPC